MSNRVGHFRHAAVGLLLLAGMAAAQSPELLEAARLHDPAGAQKARAELGACLKVKCRTADRLSLLLGYLELSEGKAAAAATQLASRPAPLGLGPFHSWYLGEAQAYSGAAAKARGTLGRAVKGAPPWLSRKLEIRIAELDLALGRGAKARPVLEAAAASRPSPELLLDRALARMATGDLSEARADLRLIALKYPLHPHAASALRMLEVDGGVQWSDEEQVQRAQRQLSGGDSAGCMETLASVREQGLGQRVALLRGRALLARGRDAEGVEQLELAAKGDSRALAVEALLSIGKRLMHQGDNSGAQRVFGRLNESFPSQAGSSEAAYLGAWLAMSAGELEAASAAFESFESRHPESHKRDEARWFRGFTLVRRGTLDEARAVLRSLKVDFPRSALIPQASYWATRAAQLSVERASPDGGGAPDAGAAVDSAAEYRELLESFPGSIYARLAQERLRELGVEANEPFRMKPEERTLKTPKKLALSAELTRAGLFAAAQEEVEAAVATVAGPDEALAFGHALQAMGQFGAAHALASRHLWGAVYTQRAPAAVTLMYPRAWRNTVEQWASSNGVDPFFTWAVMRRESGFKPDVTSVANARGLMQIIPPTARQIALELNVGPVDPDELYAPEMNVKLGTWYLSQLFRRLGHPGLVAAAYNGGPGSVMKWVEKRRTLPFDQWIEEIPFKETRGYVKQVVADFFIYQALYGDSVDRLSLVLPVPNGTGVSF